MLIQQLSLRTSAFTVVAAMALACTASACTSPSATGTTAGNATEIEQRCTKLAQVPIDPAAPLLTVVVDRTGSGSDLEISPRVKEVMQQLQATGAAMQTIGVNAVGITPTVAQLLPLDPAPDDTSANADVLRQGALTCLPLWINSTSTVTKGDNTDLLTALAAAVRQNPTQIIIISDGVNTTGEIDLTTLPADPSGAAMGVRAASSTWASAPTVPMHWFNMAETDPPLSDTHRDAIRSFWTSLLGDALTIDTRIGATVETPGS